MIESELHKLICPTSSSIPAIGNRLYIGTLPDTLVYPCVVMYAISRTEMQEAKMPVERIQVSAYANYLSSATDIIDAVRDKCKRFYGPTYTGSTYSIVKCLFDNMTYLYDDVVDKHVKILDLLVFYNY